MGQRRSTKGCAVFREKHCGHRRFGNAVSASQKLATGVHEAVQAGLASLPGNHMMMRLMEVAVGLVAAGLTTMMGFFATKLVIEGMARKLHG